MREETLYELETPYRQKFKIRGFRFGEGEKACAMVAAVLRYLSRVGLLRRWRQRSPVRPAVLFSSL